MQPIPEDTQNKVAEPILSHMSDPEPSASSPVPAQPRLPTHRHDAHSFSKIIYPEHGHNFLFFTSPSPNHKWEKLQLHVSWWPPPGGHDQPPARFQGGFQVLPFYFLAAGKARCPGLFSLSFSFTAWLKVDQVRLLSSSSGAIPPMSNLEPEVIYTRERREWAKLSSDAHEVFLLQG